MHFSRAPRRSARHSAWSGSDQIEDTEDTRGPRRPKGLVMGAQGHGEHPAAASRRGNLGKKLTTTFPSLPDNTPKHQNTAVSVRHATLVEQSAAELVHQGG